MACQRPVVFRPGIVKMEHLCRNMSLTFVCFGHPAFGLYNKLSTLTVHGFLSRIYFRLAFICHFYLFANFWIFMSYKFRVIRNDCRGFNNTLEIGVCSCTDESRGLCSSSSRKYPGTEGTNQNRHTNHHR